MIKKELSHLALDIYEETFPSFLKLYIVPKTDVSNIYVTLSTKYGSTASEFSIENGKMIKVPSGVAHFLEHKVFEQEDGVDPFTFFNQNGADANANTSSEKTTYLFSCPNHFKENIDYLLNYVFSPYFTSENVLKEKGIIASEIKMYNDNPYAKLYQTILENVFQVHPIRLPIAGTIESINQITKEDLYLCYETFYHPSNMFMVITGNVEPDEVLKIVKESLDKHSFKKPKHFELKKYKEPVAVLKKHDVIKHNVIVPKIAVNYKINLNKVKGISRYHLLLYLNILFDCKVGSTSLLLDQLKHDGIITDDIEYDYVVTDDYVVMMVLAETKEVKKFEEAVLKTFEDLELTENDFLRKKKTLISSLLFMSDNIYKINHQIMNSIIKYDKIMYEKYEQILKLNLKDFKKVMKSINLDNVNVTIIEPN